MIKQNRILCPTDLSTESDDAVRYALALARAYDAKLILLYCRQPSSIANWINSSRAQRLFEQTLFIHLDARDLKKLHWEGVVAEGEDIGLTITNEAAKRNVDLIVMRSRRRPHAAVLLGSTAETVSRRAPCPVLITHPREREWVALSTGEIDLRRILIAHDFSPDSELALRYASSFAQEYGSELHVLHVISDDEEAEPEVTWSHVGIEGLYQSATQRLQRVIPKEVLFRCRFLNVVRRGDPAREILDYAREHEIDLLCVGASGNGFGFRKLFGSTVDRLLRHAPCPALVARPVRAAADSRKAA